ncbi:hypothetical protein BH10ACT1_BH10ACT1_09710 [soil metagenome]
MAALVAGLASPAMAATSRPLAPVATSRVVLVTVPGLGWDDVTPSSMPAFEALANRGATAALSVKTIGRRTDAPAAYATMGAGTRATAPAGAGSSAFGVDEEVGSGRTAGEQAALDGRSPGPGELVVLDPDAVAAANRGRHQGARIGALGRAVVQQGWTTGLVANHDGPAAADRVAALAIATRRGRIDRGSVAPELAQVGPDGLRRTDRDALIDGLRRVPAERSVALVEVGDVAWADAARSSPAVRRRAVQHADATLGAVVAAVGDGALVVVLAPTAPEGRDQPTPFVLAGPGVVAGSAQSATTRRPGHVTLPDVAAAVLERIGAEVPVSMDGAPITASEASTSGASRLAQLQRSVAETRFIDRSTGIFLTTLPIVFASWSFLALLAAVLPLGRFGPLARLFVRWVGLGLLAVPTITYLVGTVSVRTWGQPAWALAVWGPAALVAAVLLTARRPWVAPVVLITTTWAVQVLDVLTGGHLQFGTALGNSPTVAGRFAGMGNNAYALLAAASIVLAALAWRVVDASRPGRPALAAAGAVFAVAITVDGAPGLGSDVGGVLALGPVAAFVLWRLAGRRASAGRIALAGVGTVLALAALAAVDLSRPDDEQTHLGRLVRRVADGGDLDVVARKADASLGSFTGSSLVWIPICVALLAGLLWWLARPAVRELARRPQAEVLIGASLLSAVLGAALNDSGVMVPAMMATVLVPAAVHLLLAPDGPLASEPRPEPRPEPERTP